MMMSDLIPWGRNRAAPAPRGNDETNPLLALQREVPEAMRPRRIEIAVGGAAQGAAPRIEGHQAA